MRSASFMPFAERKSSKARNISGFVARLPVHVDAYLHPVLFDHLADLGVRKYHPRRRHQFDAETPLAVGTQSVTVAILLGQANLIEQYVSLCDIEDRPLLAR